MRGKYDDGRRRGNEEWGAIKITFPQCYNLALVQRKEAENTVVLLLKIEQVQQNPKFNNKSYFIVISLVYFLFKPKIKISELIDKVLIIS